MIKQWFTSQRVSILLALISLIVALLGLPQTLATLNTSPHQLLFGAAFGLFVLAEVNSVESGKGNWTGFARLPVLAVWLGIGIESALLMIILGSVIAVTIQYQFGDTNGNYHPFNAGTNFVANSGMSILVTHGAYVLLSNQFPVLHNQSPYYDLSVVIPTLLAGSVTSLLLYLLIYPTMRDELSKIISRDILSEAMILFVALMMPVVFSFVGWLPFLCIVALVAGQNIRQMQVERTQEELELRIREISTLNSFGNAVTTQISLPSVLELVYHELNRVIDATTFFVALYDDDQNTLEYPFVIENDKRTIRQKHKLGNGLCDYAIRERRSISTTKQNFVHLPKAVNRHELKDAQYMVAPLAVGTKVIGAIGMSHSTNSGAFSKADFELLQTITSQTSLAIRNAHLYDRTVRLADNLSVINQSLQDVMFNLDRNDALKTACEIARNVTRAQKAAIFLLQPHHDQQMKRVESVGFENLDFTDYIEYPLGVFKQGPRVIADVAITTFEDIRSQAQLGQFQACLQVPLRSGNTVVGSLTVYHDEPYYYETPELNLLEMLANQITAALDNADLLQALELYAAEQAQLVHLSRISSVSLDLERIITDVSDMLSQMMGMSNISVALYYPERNVLRIESSDEYGFGLKMQEISVVEIPEMQTLLDPNAITSLTVIHADKGQPSEGLRKFLRDNHYMTLAMLPMQVNHMSLGIILLGDHKRREFSDNEYRLLEMATHQITAQIHNARLHTTTQEALVQGLEQLDLIEGISRQISQALDLELIIQNVLEAALQSTHADFAAFALPSDETEHFEIIGREVIGDQLRPYKTLLKKGSGVTGYVAEHGEMCLIEDNEASEFYVIPEGTHYPFRSSLAVPLLKAETVVGVLNLESQKTNFFTLEHAKFLNSLAGHAVISIDNADLLEKREEQIQIMRAILDSTHDGIILLDPNGMVQDANHAADTLTQLAISQHLQKPLSTLIERNDKQDEVLQQLVQTYLKFPESLHEKEHMLEREEGDLYIKTFVYRVKDNFGKTVGRLLVLRDITKQKDLQDFHDRIQNMVLHDLRGPLSAIMTSMYVSMDIVARPDDEPLETTLLPILQVSLNSANELLQLVETLRELPTITEFQVNPDTVVLGDLAQTGRDTLKAIMIESQVIVDIETPENETVYVDRGLVRRVFVNLLHNAVKFTPEDGRILIRADYESQKDGYLRVQIADTGPGIPEKDRERIFGEGEQVEGQKPERGVKGLGIGLNFCKMAVEAHGGRMWVEKDSPLSGACFAFTLPLTDDVLNAHLVEVAQLAQEIE